MVISVSKMDPLWRHIEEFMADSNKVVAALAQIEQTMEFSDYSHYPGAFTTARPTLQRLAAERVDDPVRGLRQVGFTSTSFSYARFTCAPSCTAR